MDSTVILAQVLGIMYFGMSLSLLANKKFTLDFVEEMIKSPGLMWLSGAIALIMGAVITAVNNSQFSGWQCLISVIGGLALIEGLYTLIFPKSTASLCKKWNKTSLYTIAGIAGIILGLAFLYKGFM